MPPVTSQRADTRNCVFQHALISVEFTDRTEARVVAVEHWYGAILRCMRYLKCRKMQNIFVYHNFIGSCK